MYFWYQSSNQIPQAQQWHNSSNSYQYPFLVDSSHPLIQINTSQRCQTTQNFNHLPLETQNRTPKENNKRNKSSQPELSMKKTQRNRNLGSLILKQFLKEVQSNPAEIFQILQNQNMDYLVKKFLQILKEKFPSKLTYIRPSIVKEICESKEDEDFSKIFRILLHYFLRKGYPKTILLKKKQKLSHLKQCRILYEKVFYDDT